MFEHHHKKTQTPNAAKAVGADGDASVERVEVLNHGDRVAPLDAAQPHERRHHELRLAEAEGGK